MPIKHTSERDVIERHLRHFVKQFETMGARITIDSASTKDIDDAIYFERLGDGFRMVVAIADPTRVVQPDSTEDVVARRYGQTTYVREDAVRPMLPRRLSEGELSLIAGRPRDALLFEVRLDAALEFLIGDKLR